MKKNIQTYLVLIIVFFTQFVSAQTDSAKYEWGVYPSKKPQLTVITTDTLRFTNINNGKQGSSKIIAPTEVDALTNELRQVQEPKTKGYRLQVYLSQDKEQVMKTKAEFMNNFDDVEAYIDRKAPNYVLKVGDFYNRFDANAYKMKIAKLYPNAIVVSDEVDLPKIVIE